MGLLDLFRKGKKGGDDEPEVILTRTYECVLGAYYLDRDEEKAWPLDELDETDPFGNQDILAEWLPDYFSETNDDSNGVIYLSPETIGMKTLSKNDLKNEFSLIAGVTSKACAELNRILEANDVVEDGERYVGAELTTSNVTPEAILVPDSNIVLLHCGLTLRYDKKL